MKNFLFSRTVWVNGLTVAAGLLTFFQNHELIVSNPDVVAILGIALGVVNVGLRFLTDKGVTVGPAPKPEDPSVFE